MDTRAIGRQAVALAALAIMTACGGGNSSPNSPSPVSGSPGPSGATITIGTNGAVNPSQVTVSVGQSVTFINNDTRAHDMSSDPHPIHTDCPEINAVSTLGPGQTRLTNGFQTARTCGYHDHNNPNSTALQGRIVIQ